MSDGASTRKSSAAPAVSRSRRGMPFTFVAWLPSAVAATNASLLPVGHGWVLLAIRRCKQLLLTATTSETICVTSIQMAQPRPPERFQTLLLSISKGDYGERAYSSKAI